MSLHQSLQCILLILARQGVYGGVQHRHHHGVKHKDHLVPPQDIGRAGPGINEEGAIVEGEAVRQAAQVEKALCCCSAERVFQDDGQDGGTGCEDEHRDGVRVGESCTSDG